LVLNKLKNKIIHRVIYSRLGLVLMVFLCVSGSYAQTPDEGLGEVSDEFQDCFFEALKQRGIENYEKAISTLLHCQEIDAENAAVSFELGKNYLTLKNYQLAEASFLNAYKSDSTNVWFAESLLDFYLQSNNPSAAVVYAEKLFKNGRDQGETLARLYVDTGNLEKALATIEKLKSTNGNTHEVAQLETLVRNLIRREKNTTDETAEAIPQNEEEFVRALSKLLKANKIANLNRLALNWREKSETNPVADSFLVPYFLEKNQWANVKEGIRSIFEMRKIDPETRFLLLNQVIVFAQSHPEATDLVNEIAGLQEKNEMNLPLENALMRYFEKIDPGKAETFSGRILKNDETNFEALKVMVPVLNQQKRFRESLGFSSNALELYPAQPEFYLELGKSFLGLNQAEKAIGQLLTGLDYIISDRQMENDFYRQLALAYELTGDKQKEALYKNKIKETPQN